MKKNVFFLPALMFCLMLAAVNSRAINKLQIDDFEDGTVMGWSEGGSSLNPPVNITTGGPAGTGDNYLQNISSGGSGAGSKMVMFNTAQWSGNYVTAGITQIYAAMANFGANPLSMRVAVQGPGNTRYGSATAVNLPADGQWYPASFTLTGGGLSLISGSETLATVLSNVNTIRILSNAGGPNWHGESISATLGVDNINAIPEPGLIINCIFVLWIIFSRAK